MSSFSEIWVEEKHRDFLKQSYRVEKVLFSGKSPYQSVDIVETRGHGKMLLNDGLVMISEKDEFVYHDMIAHVPLFVHPAPKKVLVVGGGDGGTAREVLRHKEVETCWMVEIDEMVVEACRRFIPQTASCLEDPRLNLKIEDAVKFMETTEEKFDVILVDSTDPIGPAQPLFGKEFYQNVFRALTEDGIVVSQAESSFYEQEAQGSLLQILNETFPLVMLYNFNNLTYPGGLWSFSFASKGLHPLKDFQSNRVKSSGLEFSYYNEEIHRAAFALPEFVKKQVGKWVQNS
ncbi:MAG: polyamine aminopropyltransferase [Bdellovibrio sp.]|nr:MAG: polyamine aminopropyltransferase [Bdellovibrio sp.]